MHVEKITGYSIITNVRQDIREEKNHWLLKMTIISLQLNLDKQGLLEGRGHATHTP